MSQCHKVLLLRSRAWAACLAGLAWAQECLLAWQRAPAQKPHLVALAAQVGLVVPQLGIQNKWHLRLLKETWQLLVLLVLA